MVDDMTEAILQFVSPYARRNDVAAMYGTVILFSRFARPARMEADWSRVNAAIIARWSLSGLQYIKRRAWSLAEARARELSNERQMLNAGRQSPEVHREGGRAKDLSS